MENSLKRFFFFSVVKVHGFWGLSGAISQKQEQIKGGNDMFVISFLRLTVSLPLSSFQPGDKSRASISKSVIAASQIKMLTKNICF